MEGKAAGYLDGEMDGAVENVDFVGDDAPLAGVPILPVGKESTCLRIGRGSRSSCITTYEGCEGATL
jgi:hypothetical protein